jgi:GTP diphosphokinase / guanosine-3',5'-bis(diphosphate) 3'-diphosphatase
MNIDNASLTLARADAFAAGAHSGQTRKGGNIPYIVHPRGVRLLLEQAGITHAPTLAAALLHDTVEDTPVTSAQLEQEFGAEIAEIVAELTDPKGMAHEARHALQAEHASSMSLSASCVKIADRTYNLRDFYAKKPETTSLERVRNYAMYSDTLYNRFKERAEVDIENKDDEARSELERAYLLLLSNLHVAVKRLAEKYSA